MYRALTINLKSTKTASLNNIGIMQSCEWYFEVLSWRSSRQPTFKLRGARAGASNQPEQNPPPSPFLGLVQPQSPPQFPVNAFATACYVRDRDTIILYQEKSKKKSAQHGCCRDPACCRAHRWSLPPVFSWGPPQTPRVTCGGEKWRMW